jgi:AbrB family looped-hinge helix DNA binding protein
VPRGAPVVLSAFRQSGFLAFRTKYDATTPQKRPPTEIAKLGKKGQVTIPRPVLKRLGLEGEVSLTVETTADGAIVLRQAVVPIETYSEERLREFDETSCIDSKLITTARRLIRARKPK